MKFRTFIVKANKSKTVNTGAVIAIVLIILSFITGFLGLLTMAAISFVVAILTVVVMAIAKKGDIQLYGVSKEYLVLTPGTITIESESFAVEKVGEIHIRIHSYSGLVYPRSENASSRSVSSGVDNKLSFEYNGIKKECVFYIGNNKHALQLCAVLREYYRNKLPVIETDMYGVRTYLLQRLKTKEDKDAFKKRHKIE
jgi:hypothetical protein